MNYLDIILGVILLIGLYKGIKNGLLIEIASLLALILGVYGAIHFSFYAADYLNERTDWEPATLNLIAFALTFIVIVLIISLAGKLLTKLASIIMLGILNKILGGAFGLLKSAFILSVILMFVSSITERLNLIDEETKDSSVLYPIVKPLAPAILPNVLNELEKLRDEKENEEPIEEEVTKTQETTSKQASSYYIPYAAPIKKSVRLLEI
ncbi:MULTISPECIES: CvpA family protein [unclassified Leeuwenhoekiella]|uniref:CvpA family protein n=1 Tax=unclassified Leeuwenhoekiella TaxID=2615029 RepID=UPI000C480306|nr:MULTISPECIES: CvpA family protein [unclassified Leeuwenhoekiella]MAW95865.1 colicin V production protein [Leeuwenhoekiella sp.]MBA82864.1 colicin V production protein [Leeuwenhoekiella sp.]|tara:strand:- start:6004 stop:6633 length:630 start_codon:yes stop_codon:yes gene_type:complete